MGKNNEKHSDALEGELIQRASDGKYVKGVSGNPRGRPKGSKNKITLLKLSAEEAWRSRNQDKLDQVLDMILQDAMEGDKAARKMIFEAIVSRAGSSDDKEQGAKAQFTVHRMDVTNNIKEDKDGRQDEAAESGRTEAPVE